MAKKIFIITVPIIIMCAILGFAFRMQIQGFHKVADIDGAVLYSETFNTCSAALEPISDSEGNSSYFTCIVSFHYRIVYQYQTYELEEALMQGIINLYDIEPYIDELSVIY